MILSLVMVAQVLAALGVIVLVLLQHGKGADMGAAFGSGTSGSLFGASGSANFLSRVTGGLAAVFFVCTLVLAFMSQRPTASGGSVMDQPVKIESGAPGARSDVPSAPSAPSGSGTVPVAGDSKADAPKADAVKSDASKSDSAGSAGGNKTESAKPAQAGDIPK